MILQNSAALGLAHAVLALHIASAAFIIAGAILTPIALKLGWLLANVMWLRIAHVAVFGIVVFQKLLGQTCFLSVWEFRLLDLAHHERYAVPIIHSIGDRAIHVPLPLSVTVGMYSLVWIVMFVLLFRIKHDAERGSRVRPPFQDLDSQPAR